MELIRYWAMPSRWTFTILPINCLLSEYDFTKKWCDPFCGKSSPASMKNDLNKNREADYHIDALDFLKLMETESFDGLLLDPPYSPRQMRECYDGMGLDKMHNDASSMSYMSNIKNEIKRILKPSGTCISFGWNSNGIGKDRGFTINKILLVAHGGNANDTIVTVETKSSQMSLI